MDKKKSSASRWMLSAGMAVALAAIPAMFSAGANEKRVDRTDRQSGKDSGDWVEVPFSGSITITKAFKGDAEMKEEGGKSGGQGGSSLWSASSNGQLRATITHCREIKDEEGLIIGYQPVGNVSGHIQEKETLSGGGFSSVSNYSANDRKDHPARPDRRDGWCTLTVNPQKQIYRLSFPSILLSKGRGTTTITIRAKDFSHTETEKFEGIAPFIDWDSSFGPDREKMTYSPRSGRVAGSHTFHTTETPQSIRSTAARVDDPKFDKIAAAAQELEAIRRSALGRAPQFWDGSLTASWNLQIGKAKARVVLEPVGEYASWMPQLPQGTGNMIQVKARIVEPAGLAGKIEFKLEDVGKEPGLCMNEPADNADDTLDLAIAPIGSGLVFGGDNQTARTEGDETEASVFVQARDWGAYGRLSAKAKLVLGGEEVEVDAVYEKTGEPFLSIPKDENSNSVADGWEEQNGIYPSAGDADADDTPEGKCQGDGFSVYEEYRGFFVQDAHRRLNPKKKDLFVYDPDNLVKGGALASATQLEVHFPSASESHCGGSSEDRVVNFNADRYHVVDQHGLWLKKEAHGTSRRYNWGACEGGAEIGPPRTAEKFVLVFADQIREDITRVFRENEPEIRNTLGQKGVRPDAAWLEGQIQAAIGMVATHEASHGLGVSHHYKSLRATLPKGKDIEQAIIEGNISPSTGQLSCVMRYIWDGSKHPRIIIGADNEVLTMLCGRPWGNTLCGPGGFDDCRSQIVVSDAEKGQFF